MTGGTSTPPSAVLLHLFVEMIDRYEPGLVKVIKAILEAQRFKFTQVGAGGVGIAVSEDGRRVANSRGNINWAVGTPALRNSGCVRVTVHQSGYGGFTITIGVIGTADPGDARHGNNSFNHATAHGWQGGYGGHMYLAGQCTTEGHGGWPSGGWQTGDTAALTLDAATNTLTLKHKRLARAFTISLAGGVAEWFVNVGLGRASDSVEVQPMSTAAYDAFL